MKKNFFKKIAAVATMSAMMVATMAQSVLAAEKVTYYFVDCGDYVVDTITTGTEDDTRDDNDAMGIYQSVTEQAYGVDAGTGKTWGIVADAYDLGDYDGSLGIRLVNAWAFEFNGAAADWHRNWSNTYSKDDATPSLTYKFELPAGTYDIEACFVDPWDVSDQVTLTGNGTQLGYIETIVQTNGGAADIETKYGGEVITGTVTVGEDGVLTLEATSTDACVNCAWIKIVGDKVEPPVQTGDVSVLLPAALLAVSAVAAVALKRRTVAE